MHNILYIILDNLSIGISCPIYYNIFVRQGNKSLMKGSEEMENGMTNAEFNSFLETLALLIESKAITVQDAAEIVRQAKTK